MTFCGNKRENDTELGELESSDSCGMSLHHEGHAGLTVSVQFPS